MREINLLIWDQHVALLWVARRDREEWRWGGGGAIVKVVCSSDVMSAFDLMLSLCRSKTLVLKSFIFKDSAGSFIIGKHQDNSF